MLEINDELQKAWGKLTDDELEKTKGDMKSIGDLILQKYGETQEIHNKKISDILKRFENKKDEVVDDIKNKLK